ncbi:uncharacterized protein LOC117114993, partial [Anneissia japonica]|uniref:uncharacterized protein LOC117114993 n=1 Tax=Anneissia japonica TaxID=1529436 RepID=UPI0014258F9E
MLGTSWKRMVNNGQTNFALPQIGSVDMTDGRCLNQHINTLDLNKQNTTKNCTSNRWKTGLDDVVTLPNEPIEAHGSEIDEDISELPQNHRLKPRIKRTDSTRAPLDLPVLAIIEPEVSPTLHKPKYFRSSGLFMTQRSRTDTSVASGGPKRKGNCREPAGPQDVQRLAYLQVDTLQQGDIF